MVKRHWDSHRESDRGDRKRIDRPNRSENYTQRKVLFIGDDSTCTEQSILDAADSIVLEYLDPKFLELVAQIITELPFKIPLLAVAISKATSKLFESGECVIKYINICAQSALEVGNWRDFKLLLRMLFLLNNAIQADFITLLLSILERTYSQNILIRREVCYLILISVPFLRWDSHQANSSQVQELGNKALACSKTCWDKYEDDTTFDFLVVNLFGIWAANPHQYQIERCDCLNDAISEKKVVIACNVPADLKIKMSCTNIQEMSQLRKTNAFLELEAFGTSDCISDTIEILHYNRKEAAKFLVDFHLYFLLVGDDIRGGPETVADFVVDSIFDHILSFRSGDIPQMYYYSLMMELCKVSASLYAPRIGRWIRVFFQNISNMDLEIMHNFEEWFCLHLSNFNFSWKWEEWVPEVLSKDKHDPQVIFVTNLLELELFVSKRTRIESSVPESLHSFLPGKCQANKFLLIDEQFELIETRDAFSKHISTDMDGDELSNVLTSEIASLSKDSQFWIENSSKITELVLYNCADVAGDDIYKLKTLLEKCSLFLNGHHFNLNQSNWVVLDIAWYHLNHNGIVFEAMIEKLFIEKVASFEDIWSWLYANKSLLTNYWIWKMAKRITSLSFQINKESTISSMEKLSSLEEITPLPSGPASNWGQSFYKAILRQLND